MLSYVFKSSNSSTGPPFLLPFNLKYFLVLLEELTIRDLSGMLLLLISIRGEQVVKVKSKYVNYLVSLLKMCFEPK